MTLSADRRTFLLGASACVVTASTGVAFAQEGGTTHEVKMLNVNPDNPRQRMVFSPRILRVKPGDSVKFLSSMPGHNSQSSKGMIPAGAEGWKSKANQEFTVTLTQPGVYGYNCAPHQAAGMVGLIVVEGEGMLDNLEEAKKAKQIGLAKKVWGEIWKEAEEMGVLNT
ncbi:MAG: pseudoazurin [Parvularculaceae bacterium]|nr:pseudoazurin [Parvularculaceae bacterium]